MTTMIERVAKAIAETGNGGDWDSKTFYQEEHKEFHRKRARAAIEAMREPSDGMVDDGDEAICPDVEGRHVGLGADRCWAAMIDAALKEG